MKTDMQHEKSLNRLGMRLREIRTQKGWTLEQTEEHGWVSWRHLQKIEAGKNVTIVTLMKVSKLYKVSLSDIFDGIL